MMAFLWATNQLHVNSLSHYIILWWSDFLYAFAYFDSSSIFFPITNHIKQFQERHKLIEQIKCKSENYRSVYVSISKVKSVLSYPNASNFCGKMQFIEKFQKKGFTMRENSQFLHESVTKTLSKS